jgi:hypothetical protein
MDPAPTTDLERQIDRLIFVRVRREWLLDFFDEGKARNAVRNNLDFKQFFVKRCIKLESRNLLVQWSLPRIAMLSLTYHSLY